MKISSSAMLNPGQAKKRLFYWLLVFFITITVPVYFLLNKVYAQLENEVWYRERNQAELLVERIEQQLLEKLQAEQDRPIAEYSFFNVLENQLLQSTSLNFSPLSELPPKSDLPGLVGYFQIDPNGRFHIPALPELSHDLHSGLSSEALAERIALKSKLRNLLADNAVSKQDQKIVSIREQGEKKVKDELLKKNSFNDYFSSVEQDDSRKTALSFSKAKPSAAPSKKALTLSEEKLQKLNIETSAWKQKNTRALVNNKRLRYAPEYRQKARKETVKIPEQSSAQAVMQKNQAPQILADSAISEAEAVLGSAQLTEGRLVKNENNVKNNSRVVNILSFESEVSPLKVRVLSQGYLCFYRHVWREKSRYIQGFIVDQSFLYDIIQPTVLTTNNFSLNSLILVHKGNVLQQFKKTQLTTEHLLYRQSLLPPFQKMEVLVNTGPLSVDSGKQVLDMISITLSIIMSLGFILFYRLMVSQINLATQQRNFISSVSHELKTPLTSIRMYSEMLRADWVADESRKQSYYDYIYFESERLSRLISNVLQLAKLDHKQSKNQLVTLSAKQLMQQVQTKISAQIEASHYQLNLILPPEQISAPEVKVDEDAFFQIMINLVDNAIKFSKQSENKHIDIGFKLINKGSNIVFYVRDYGPGVEKQQMKKIFQLFYRAGDEMTRTQPGTGIGLALVVQLAESMGATVDLVNRDPGAEFQLKCELSD